MDYEYAWSCVEQAYEMGEVIEGRIIYKRKGGYTVEIEELRAFLPNSQIDLRSLEKGADLIDEYIDLKVIEFEVYEKIIVSHKLACEQKRSILIEKLRKQVGKVLEGTVKNIQPYGAFVDIGGIDGLIFRDDLSWEKVDRVEEFLEVGQSVRVLLLKLTEKGICLGLKQLTPEPVKEQETIHPKIGGGGIGGQRFSVIGKIDLGKLQKQCDERVWSNVEQAYKTGEFIEGCIVCKRKGGYTVEIEGLESFLPNSQIDWKSLEKGSGLIGEHIDLKVIEFKKYENIVVSHKLSCEEELRKRVELELEIKDIKFPGRVITESFDQYSGGILLPQNLYYKGKLLPVDFSVDFIQNYFSVGETGIFSFIIKDTRGGERNDWAMLSMNIENSIDEEISSFWRQMEIGQTYKVKVTGESHDYYYLCVENKVLLRGYIEKGTLSDEDYSSGDEMQLELGEKGDCELQLIHFVCPAIGMEKLPDEDVVFLREEEWQMIPEPKEQNISLIKQILEKYPHLRRESFEQLTLHPLYCRVCKDSYGIRYQEFIEENPDYFAKHNFNVSYHINANNVEKIIIFDENHLVIEIGTEGENFCLTGFYTGHTDRQALFLIENNKFTKLKISGKMLFFRNFDQAIPKDKKEEFSRYAKWMKDLSLIISKCRSILKEEKRDKAEDYHILGKYLQFQKEKEEKAGGEIVEIPTKRLGHTSSGIGAASALVICFEGDEYSRLTGDCLEMDNKDIYVSVLDEEENTKHTGILEYCSEEQCYHLCFSSSHIDMDELISNGVRLKRKVNTKHLEMQHKSIKNYLEHSKLYDDLILGKLREPDITPYEEMEFFDEKLKNIEADNSQPLAVKKALGNKDVLLIQGPPGTGKTTVIVEVIRQLASQGKTVLVCSQAKAAVRNICERILPYAEDGSLRIESIGEDGNTEDWGKHFENSVYTAYLENNKLLIEKLAKGEALDGIGKWIDEIGDYTDSDSDRKYKKFHHYVCDYYQKAVGETGKSKDIENILRRLIPDMKENGITRDLLELQRLQSKNVILGTCIGIGMNRVLGRQAIEFDTVIVDEAAKANLAETIVPVRLAKNCILVGDDNQLPPYMDREEIKSFVAEVTDMQGESIYTDKSVMVALGKSLFEEFHSHLEDGLFPRGSIVTLNYQYRMNPAIGNYISRLFYHNELKNGLGTENQNCDMLDSDPIVFVDTTSKETFVKDETGNRGVVETYINKSYYNQREIDIIVEQLLPELRTVLSRDSSLKVGIISPYRMQCEKLRAAIEDFELKKCVCTIDSIQGREFDIVIFSFVRSFGKSVKRTVGFLDDMRRLNVSLSRAKKKLILVGNLHTLLREEAHEQYDTACRMNPIDVFKSFSSLRRKIFDKSAYEFFCDSIPEEGTVIENCELKRNRNKKNSRQSDWSFTFSWNGRKLTLPILIPEHQIEQADCLRPNETVSIKYIGKNKNDQARFVLYGEQFVTLASYFSVSEEKSNNKNFTAFVYDKSAPSDVLLKLEDDSRLKISIEQPFLWLILEKEQQYNFFKNRNGKFFLNRKLDYEAFKRHYSEGESVSGEVMAEQEGFYIVKAGGYHGMMFKKRWGGKKMCMNESYKFVICKMDDEKRNVTFKLA
ncbi:AAA domain-containing protein [Bacteroides fluxus]|uniref:AAA domain-containing protein n=1 Tax=Bacteroides fluxus TaxID=626930 RepID=UPI0023529E06|nr:AAA domain-containing protein [Bacteroides fluxus]